MRCAKKFHISILPIIFCLAVIVLDVVALTSGKIARPKSSSAEPLLLDFKADFKDKIKSALPDESEGLALGYLLGDKSELTTTLKETIATVGLTHLVVASGAHLGIILKAVRKSFGKLSRGIGLLAGLGAVMLFIGVIGLTPSALRAGLVAGLSLLAGYFGRDLRPARLLLYVAAVTILIDPTYPVNLSWLLSFASFAAILLLAPAFEGYFYGPERKPGALASLLIASLSATLLTAPILLFYFGQISLISILANLLISPTLALTMLLTFLTGLFSNPLTAFMVHFLVQYHIKVATFLAEQPFFLIGIEKNNPFVFLLYVPIILVAYHLWRLNRYAQERLNLRKQSSRKNKRFVLKYS